MHTHRAVKTLMLPTFKTMLFAAAYFRYYFENCYGIQLQFLFAYKCLWAVLRLQPV